MTVGMCTAIGFGSFLAPSFFASPFTDGRLQLSLPANREGGGGSAVSFVVIDAQKDKQTRIPAARLNNISTASATTVLSSATTAKSVTTTTTSMIVGLPLHFIINNAGDDTNADCGGCSVLRNMANVLQAMNYSVVRVRKPCDGLKAFDTHINVRLFSEGIGARCVANATVRWILAPMGIIFGKRTTERWNQEDLVFNYGILANGAARAVPYTNLLLAQLNPFDGDGMDVNLHAPQQRKGSIFIMRKAKKFHKRIQIIHGPGAKPVRGGTKSQYLQRYLRTKYCYCYDPYSFHLQMAAMMGCISIVAPLGNLNKAEWLMTTLYAGYLADNNLSNMLGIAYGNSTSELEYAERTMSGTREELIRVREWGEKVSVPRMTRDVMRYVVSGARSGFEGALLVRDMYPPGWWTRAGHQ